jgi:DNA-nicking Smr family endonuclease
MNKYERIPEYILDLHRQTLREAEVTLLSILKAKKYNHIRIITGKGLHSSNGPVIKNFVRSLLQSKNIKFSQSKIADGGEGAFEVFL